MTDYTAQYIFKLRRNIALEGDLSLARLELESFSLSQLQGVADIKSSAAKIPALANEKTLAILSSNVRISGSQGFSATGSLSLLPELIRTLSFIQEIYCVTQNATMAKNLVDRIKDVLGPVTFYKADNEYLTIIAVPHYAIIELSEIIARRSETIADTKKNLNQFLDGLLHKTANPHSLRLADAALAAASTTSHLSHDIHYYKAKFFPRMVRSLINICAQRLGQGEHRLIDNFVGSGTALLEASILGIRSAGLDIDPLSVLISEAKIEVPHLNSELVHDEVVEAVKILERQTNNQPGLFDSVGRQDGKAITFPSWLMKNRRMTAEIGASLSDEIIAIRAAVAACDPRVQKLFRVLMSDAISRKIRMRFLGTGVGRFSLTFAKTPLKRLFTKSLERYAKVVATCEWLRKTINLPFAEASVLAADTRRIPFHNSQFDILVTSPPYLPASSGRESYAKARAISLIALGMKSHENVDDLVNDSIGSMSNNGSSLDKLTDRERDIVEWLGQDELRAIKAEPTARYFLDMRQTFVEINRVLSPGGLAVIVSGKESTFYQFSTRNALYVVPAAEMLAEEAQKAGLEVEALYDIQLNKANMNARPRSLDEYYETLIVLRKTG